MTSTFIYLVQVRRTGDSRSIGAQKDGIPPITLSSGGEKSVQDGCLYSFIVSLSPTPVIQVLIHGLYALGQQFSRLGSYSIGFKVLESACISTSTMLSDIAVGSINALMPRQNILKCIFIHEQQNFNKNYNFHWNFMVIWSHGSNYWYPSICLDNNIASTLSEAMMA